MYHCSKCRRQYKPCSCMDKGYRYEKYEEEKEFFECPKERKWDEKIARNIVIQW